MDFQNDQFFTLLCYWKSIFSSCFQIKVYFYDLLQKTERCPPPKVTGAIIFYQYTIESKIWAKKIILRSILAHICWHLFEFLTENPFTEHSPGAKSELKVDRFQFCSKSSFVLCTIKHGPIKGENELLKCSKWL